MIRPGILLLVALMAGCSKQPPAREIAASSADAGACSTCHPSHAKTFHQTGMGRSFYPAVPANMVENFGSSNELFHKPSERHYRLTRLGDRFFLRRHQTGSNGQEVNAIEKEIHYVMGSGNHARTYIHRDAAGRLMELPVGWYPEKGGFFAMSPGYDRPIHPDFRREIGADCLFCHAALPATPAAVPTAIDCQRCHGPGGAHVEAARKSKPDLAAMRAAIVNPAKLKRDQQLEVCMQCHLETTSFPLPEAIRRFDAKGTYRPGLPLSDFFLYFDHAPGKGYDDKFEIVNSVYRLRKSACFQKSGTMTCSTCHNPHNIPRGQAAADHYASVCRTCHTSLERGHPPGNDCASCHMPQRRTEDVIHAVMTDHLIQRRKPANALAARAEKTDPPYQGEVVPYYPASMPPSAERDLYVAMAQVVQGSNTTAGITRLEAAIGKHRPSRPEYFNELGQALVSKRQGARAIAAFEKAVEKDGAYVPALRGLGIALMEAGQTDRARETLERAVKVAPSDATLRHELGQVHRRTGRGPEAVASLREAVRLNPDFPEGHNSLGGALLETGDRAGAEAAFRTAILHQPDSAEAHNNLAMLLAGGGDSAQAEYHFQRAIQFDPRMVNARFNYGSLLASTGRFDAAEQQIEAAIAIQPAFAEGRELLGSLFNRKREWARAIVQFREAVRLQPSFGRAHLGLGLALGAARDLNGARRHLTLAAGSPDPAVRQDAVELLQSMESAR